MPPAIHPTIEQMTKATISTATMVEPTGVPAKMEARIPKTAQNTENIAENTMTDLKLLNNRIEESAGKIINADIKREPTRFIANTIITAMTTAIRRL